MSGINKLCKSLVFKYAFGFSMRHFIFKLFKFKVVKGLFRHPVQMKTFAGYGNH